MLFIGLTGQVASGKSTVAKIFQNLNISLIDADKISRELTHSSSYIFPDIVKYFGSSIINDDGELNRKKLRQIIFNDKEKRLWLENLLHPAIRMEIDLQRKKCISPYCIIEIPLLTDRKPYPYLNRVLLVISDEKLRIKRLMERDKISLQDAKLILQNQETQDTYKSIADDIIFNNDDLVELEKNVLQLHAKYIALTTAS